MGRVVSWVKFFVGRVVTRVELSRGSSFFRSGCLVGRVVSWVELSVSSCHMRRDDLTPYSYTDNSKLTLHCVTSWMTVREPALTEERSMLEEYD